MMSRSAQWREARVKTHLLESAALKQQLVETTIDQIVAGADLIATAFKQGGKLYLCGNGGSAADCQHMAAEFLNRLTPDFVRPALPAVALTTDTSFLTAYANDADFSGIFARQLQALGTDRDVLLGISTSGSSLNIIQAVETAHSIGMKSLVLTGVRGRLQEMATVSIPVPSQQTQLIQEAHLTIEHILCDLVEQILYPATSDQDAVG